MLCFVWWWSVANADVKEHRAEKWPVRRPCADARVRVLRRFALCQKERSTYFAILVSCKVCVPAVSFRRSNVPRCVPVAKLQQA